jgi:hypothetical protein
MTDDKKKPERQQGPESSQKPQLALKDTMNRHKNQQVGRGKRRTRWVSPHPPIDAVIPAQVGIQNPVDGVLLATVSQAVIPAQAGIQNSTHVAKFLDSRLRGNDDGFIGPGNAIGLDCGF